MFNIVRLFSITSESGSCILINYISKFSLTLNKKKIIVLVTTALVKAWIRYCV